MRTILPPQNGEYNKQSASENGRNLDCKYEKLTLSLVEVVAMQTAQSVGWKRGFYFF
jgi:hypothetical protein